MNGIHARRAIESLPMSGFDEVFPPAPLLVLAPHPDDESLGCGGMIAEACAGGRAVHIAILTDGSMSHPGSRDWPPDRLRRKRQDEARSAAAILGVPAANLLFLGQKDGAAPHDGAAFAAVLDALCRELRSRQIATICASWIGDPHVDHVAAARLASAASRRTGARHLAYPIWAWTAPDDASLPEVQGGYRLPIGPFLPLKRRAIAAHQTQCSGLIGDDAQGIPLSPGFLAHFDRGWEAFLVPP